MAGFATSSILADRNATIRLAQTLPSTVHVAVWPGNICDFERCPLLPGQPSHIGAYLPRSAFRPEPQVVDPVARMLRSRSSTREDVFTWTSGALGPGIDARSLCSVWAYSRALEYRSQKISNVSHPAQSDRYLEAAYVGTRSLAWIGLVGDTATILCQDQHPVVLRTVPFDRTPKLPRQKFLLSGRMISIACGVGRKLRPPKCRLRRTKSERRPRLRKLLEAPANLAAALQQHSGSARSLKSGSPSLGGTGEKAPPPGMPP